MEALKLPDLKETQSDTGFEKSDEFYREEDSDAQETFESLSNDVSSTDEKSTQKVKKKVQLDYEYKGERFHIHRKNGLIYINHPKWSLVGMGETLLKAENDMLKDAKLIADEYITQPESELSKEAQNLKHYLLKII